MFALPVRVRGTPAVELIQVEASPCDGVCCGDFGHCEVRGDEGVCVCHDSYVGQFCDARDPCLEVDCGEHGTCRVRNQNEHGNGDGICYCAPGHVGDNCEIPNVECEGDFTDWSECSTTCEEGFSFRTFNVTTPKSGWGCECEFEDGLVESKDCFERMCPIDCQGHWGDYGACSQTCEEGTKTRGYVITTEAQYGGIECPVTEDAACNEGECPIDCVGEWSGYDACSTTCNTGFQTKTFNVSVPAQHGGQDCRFGADQLETQDCNDGLDDVCAIHCEGDWSGYDKCSVSCGGGVQNKTFSVSVEANHKGDACPHGDGDLSPQECNNDGCPVDCVGAWGEFDTCTTTCGGGEQTQVFSVSVVEQNGGVSCLAAFNATDGKEHTQTCNSQPCPEHCAGEWGEFSECNVTCAEGSIYRTFSVTAEAKFGGLECDFDNGDVETDSCDAGPCPIDCEGAFGEYDACANENMCGTGSQTRTFSVSVDEAYGGKSCEYAHLHEATRDCDLTPCPIDCEGDFEAWSNCSVTCSIGFKSRGFVVSVAPQFGGEACPETEVAECNDAECPVDCVGRWSDYGECSDSCGADGEQERTFHVQVESAHGGDECAHGDAETQSQGCNIWECPDLCHGVCCGDFGHCSEGTCVCYHGHSGPACEFEDE